MVKKQASGTSRKRNYKKTISFNQNEMRVIEHFFEKYNIKNHSKFFRETIVSTILQKVEEDHPKLF